MVVLMRVAHVVAGGVPMYVELASTETCVVCGDEKECWLMF